jgi:hypothetical protein
VRAATIAVGLVACVAPDTDESEVAQSRQAVDACRSVVLDASVSYAPRRHDDAVVDLSPAFRFAVPSEIPIVQGNGGNQHATLRSRFGGIETKCRYRSPGVSHPHTPAQIAQASRYLFEHCTSSSHAEDDHEEEHEEEHEDDHDGDGHSGQSHPHHAPPTAGDHDDAPRASDRWGLEGRDDARGTDPRRGGTLWRHRR